MTVLADVRTNLISQIAAQLPGVQVSSTPLGEDQKLRESIWFEGFEGEAEWRSLGRPATHGTRNRSEIVRVELRLHVYREGGDQTDVSATAIGRAEELVEAIEAALVADFSLGDTVTHALLSRYSLTPVGRESGWAIDGRATVEATHFPT